jgi:hypothetical protein
MRNVVSTLAVITASALVGCASEATSESSDFTATNQESAIVCNDGDLVLTKSKDNDWEFIATVTDQGVVDWFVAQSEGTVEGRSSAGNNLTVQADFPWQVTIEEQEDGTRHLVLGDLRSRDFGALYQTSGGPPGSSLEWVDNSAMRLSVGNGFLPNSKEVVTYELGSWTFETCEETGPAPSDDEPGPAPSLAGVYDGPGGATLLVESGEALVVLPDGSEVSGSLDRDGTLGGSYLIVVPEGMVCGTFAISLWESEGVLGDGSEVDLRWVRPDGSVASQCGHMLTGEGPYVRR